MDRTYYPTYRRFARLSKLLLLSILLPLFAVEALAQVPGYSYRLQMATDAAKVSGTGNLNNFPVLIDFTHPNLRTVANGGQVENASGYDIVFTASDGSTVLNHQLESYNATTGHVLAWVRFPTLSATADTDFYIYYGNPGVSSNPSSTATWDNNYRMVHHYQSNLQDATSNGNNGTNNGTGNTAAKIGDGRLFNGSDFIQVANDASLNITGPLTISAWVNATNLASNPDLISKGDFDESYSTYVQNGGNLVYSQLVQIFWFQWPQILTSTSQINNNDWHYLTFVKNGSGRTIYINGIASGNDNVTQNTTGNNNPLNISSAASPFNGRMDEVRISNTGRPANWISTEYTNQNDPTTFIYVVNDAPVLSNMESTPLDYLAGDGPITITSGLTVQDNNNTNLQGATAEITGNYQNGEDLLAFSDQNGITGSWNAASGLLTLSGSATLAEYEAALQSVQYENSSGTPVESVRTVTFTADDGVELSNQVSRDIEVRATNELPVLSNMEPGAINYTEGDGNVAITSAVTVSDDDDTDLDSAKVTITGNYFQGEDLLDYTDALGISGSFDASEGTLTLTGVASLADYQTALRSVTYQNSSSNPVTLSRTIEFTVNDGNSNSNAVSRSVQINTTNSSPQLGNIEATILHYKAGDPPTNITETITVSDPDGTTIQGATIQISGNYDGSQDQLSFNNLYGITGSWDQPSGTLTLSGTAPIADYQTALRTVKYENRSSNPSSAPRTVAFSVNDGTASSNTLTRDISVSIPGSISGLELWLKGDAGISASNGNPVVTWEDQSGNNRDFTGQAQGGNRPTFAGSVPALNNMPAVNFAGNGDFMEDPDGENYINGLSEFTLFVVMKSDQTNTDRGFWNTQNPDSQDDIFTIRYDADGANAGAVNLIKAGILADNPANQLESFSDVQTTSGQITMLQWDDGNIFDLFVDGVLNNPSGAASPPSGTLTNASTVIVGKGGKDHPDSFNQSWDGQIAEVILYGRRISDSERQSVEDYLSDKYGISIRLLTQATGGEAISADDANIPTAFTSLTGPIIREDFLGKLAQGETITLKAPDGFEWDTGGSAPTTSIGPAFGGNTNLQVSFTSRTASELTFTVDQASTAPGRPGKVTFGNLRVRPTTGILPNTGTITNIGTTGPGGTTNYGTLNMVAGARDSMVYMQPPTSNNVNEIITPAVRVQLVDQFGNSVEESGVAIDLSLTTGTGTLSGTTTVQTNSLGIAEFTDLLIDQTGTKRVTAQSAGLNNAESSPFDIVAAGSFTSFNIEKTPSGTIAPKTAGQQFDIRISAVDGSGNLDTSFNGTVSVSSNLTMGTGIGTTSNFTNGVLSTHTVSITNTGNAKIQVVNSSGSQTGESNTFAVTAGAASGLASTITANPQVILNNGSSTSTITVQLKDQYSNNLTAGGDNVTLSTDNGTLGSVTDNGDGTYTAVLTSTTSQVSANISGTVNGTGIDDEARVDFTSFDAIWEGTLGDAPTSDQWEYGDNWNTGTVPGSGDIVLIPTDPAVGNKYPVVSIINQTVGEVAIETGADITVSGGVNFVIEGKLTGDGEINGSNNDSLTVGGDISIPSLPIGTLQLNGSTRQTIVNPHTYTNLVIDNPAGVDISDNLFVNGTLSLTDGTLTIPSGKNLIANTKNIGSGELAFERIVDGAKGWRMISSPVSSTYEDLLDSTVTQGYPGAFYDSNVSPNDTLQPTVLWYDETYPGTDNQRWRTPGNATDALTDGRGLFVYFFGDIAADSRYNNPLPDTLLVNGQEFEGGGTEFDFNVTYTATADTGWNFIGNPFGATLDWDASGWTKTNIDNTIYVWDPEANGGNGEYLTWNGSTGTLGSGRIPPFQGFWVKANGPGAVLRVSKSNKTTGGNFIRKEASGSRGATPILGLELAHEDLSASVNLSFSNTAKRGKDPNDGYRLLPFSDTFLELFMTFDDGTQLVTNNLPENLENRMLIPVHVGGYRNQEPISGEFALSWPGIRNIPNAWIITLVDHQTGEEIDMRTENYHKFGISADGKGRYKTNNEGGRFKLKETSDSEARFTIRISTQEIESNIPSQGFLDQNYPNPFNPATTIRFGLSEDTNVQLEVYDILGRKVKTLISDRLGAGVYTERFNARSLASGVYIYRLVTGDKVFVKKFTFVK